MINGITLAIIIIIILLFTSLLLSILIGIFVIPMFKTPKKLIQEIVDIMELTEKDHFADLGSGDGRIIFKAYEQSKCTCTGYEIAPTMLLTAQTKKSFRYPLTKKISFVNEDVFKVDLNRYSKIYCYLDLRSLNILKTKFNKYLESGGEIYCYKNSIAGVEDYQKILLSNNHPLYIYK